MKATATLSHIKLDSISDIKTHADFFLDIKQSGKEKSIEISGTVYKVGVIGTHSPKFKVSKIDSHDKQGIKGDAPSKKISSRAISHAINQSIMSQAKPLIKGGQQDAMEHVDLVDNKLIYMPWKVKSIYNYSKAIGAFVEAVADGDIARVKQHIKKDMINSRIDTKKSTPLMLAAQERHENIIVELLKQGADPTARDIYGNTAIDYAGSDVVCRLIIEEKIAIDAEQQS